MSIFDGVFFKDLKSPCDGGSTVLNLLDKVEKKFGQAGAELGQAQISLGFIKLDLDYGL